MACRAISIAEAGGGACVPDVQEGGVWAVGEVPQPIRREVSSLARPALPDDAGQLQAQVRHERPVVDGSGVGPSGAAQFLGRLRESPVVCGNGHEVAQAAE
jgi:hypothetical protein